VTAGGEPEDKGLGTQTPEQRDEEPDGVAEPLSLLVLGSSTLGFLVIDCKYSFTVE